jgi:fermentation-respiration switch protein FrsA (DUF1100 family)
VPAGEPVTTTFASGSEQCEASLYRPGDGVERAPCVVMANGFSLTRQDGLDTYARALADAGAVVFAFDHRHLGGSGGEPRGLIRVGRQLADWRAAVDVARSLDGVDPARIVTWGFSLAGGHAATIAAADPEIAGFIGLCPMLDGLARVSASPPALAAKLALRGIAELAGFRRPIKVTTPPGGLGFLSLPGEADGFARVVPEGSPWINQTYPAVVLRAPTYRPVKHAPSFGRPAHVSVGERDITVSNAAIERFAERASDATLVRFDGDHFDPLVPGLAAQLAAGQAEFLRTKVVEAA